MTKYLMPDIKSPRRWFFHCALHRQCHHQLISFYLTEDTAYTIWRTPCLRAPLLRSLLNPMITQLTNGQVECPMWLSTYLISFKPLPVHFLFIDLLSQNSNLYFSIYMLREFTEPNLLFYQWGSWYLLLLESSNMSDHPKFSLIHIWIMAKSGSGIAMRY